MHAWAQNMHWSKKILNLQSFDDFVYLLAVQSAIFAVIHRVEQNLDMLGQRCCLQTKRTMMKFMRLTLGQHSVTIIDHIVRGCVDKG